MPGASDNSGSTSDSVRITQVDYGDETIPIRLRDGTTHRQRLHVSVCNRFLPRVWSNTRRTVYSLQKRGLSAAEAVAILEDRDFRSMDEADALKRLGELLADFTAGKIKGRQHGLYALDWHCGAGQASRLGPLAGKARRR